MDKKKRLLSNDNILFLIAFFLGSILKSIVEGLIGLNFPNTYKFFRIFAIEDALIFIICTVCIYLLLKLITCHLR